MKENKTRTLCSKCGKFCDAQLGVFEKLCPECEAKLIAINKKKHPTLFR